MGVEISSEEFAERRGRAVAAARERGLDGLLVWSRQATSVDHFGHVMYLTNQYTAFPDVADNPPLWSGHAYSALVLPVAGDPVVVTDDCRADLVRIDDVRIVLDVPGTTGRVLRELGLHEGRLGLAGRDSLLHANFLELQEACGTTLRLEPADDLLNRLRMVKSDAEVTLMREAAAVGCEWMRLTMEAVEPGRTEGECVAEGLRYAAIAGAYPYDVAVASGPHADRFQWARLPSWDTKRKLEPGDLLHADIWGPAADGYFTDLVRTAVAGRKPSPEQREILEGAVGQIEHIIAGVRPGATAQELYRRGMEWLEDNGFGGGPGASLDESGAQLGELFPAFGHALGLGVEPPWLADSDATVLKPNMVLAIETQVGRPGVGAAGFEQDVLVTADGHEVLTAPCPSRWWD